MTERADMLTIIINWIYVLFITFCLGYAFLRFTERFLGYRIRKTANILMAGLACATVYAQAFSLFAGVGLAANICLLAASVLVALVWRKDIAAILRKSWTAASLSRKVLTAALFLAWAYFTSRGYIYYDTDLYHAQSIRWIEEYGVVKGLGNLHERFAYNSSSFALSALFSLKFVMGYSMHAMNGFFAFLLSIQALDAARAWKRRPMGLAFAARAASIYYLTTLVDEVVSPASDLSVMCVLFYLAIEWLDQLEADRRQVPAIEPYALLSVLGVYALTLKLTAGLILLLVLKPAAALIRRKKWKEIAIFLALGLAAAVPWMARTVLISGWLLYPFPYLDLFSVDWKMPKQGILVDAAQIKAWGRALYNVALLDVPAWTWMRNWFATTLSALEKLLVLADFLSLLVVALGTVFVFWKKRWEALDELLVAVTLVASYLFWQFSAPLIRYGYAYVLLLAAVVLGGAAGRLLRGKGKAALLVLLLLYGCYKLFITADYVYGTRLIDNYVVQKGYGSYEVEAYDVDGETIYVPVTGDRTGYDSFPAAPTRATIRLRGDGLKDGFRPAGGP